MVRLRVANRAPPILLVQHEVVFNFSDVVLRTKILVQFTHCSQRGEGKDELILMAGPTFGVPPPPATKSEKGPLCPSNIVTLLKLKDLDVRH